MGGTFLFLFARPKIAAKNRKPSSHFPKATADSSIFSPKKSKIKSALKTLALEIIPNEKGVDVIYLNTETNEIRGLHCEKIIFAAPIFTAKYLIRDFKQNAPNFVNEFQHNAWFVANLFLKDRPKNRFAKDFPLAWDNVLYESPCLGYVNSTHQKGIDYGAAVFTYYYPMCGEENGRAKLFALDHAQLADIVLSDLSMAHKDIRDLTTRIDIMRWGHAMISPRTNFLFSGARDEAQKPFRNIHFAHSDLSGIALFEEAFFHGIRAANEILEIKL